MALSPFPIDPALTAIAVAYRNQSYIADMVLPRVRVGKQAFSFLQYPEATAFDVMDTRVGRRSKPNEVVHEATEVFDATNDYGLDQTVPQADIDNSDARYRPLDMATMQLAELIAVAREARVATLVTTLANYPSDLRVTLSGPAQYSDYTNSDPVRDLNARLDEPLMRPNKLVFGQAAWSVFRSHPRVVQAVFGTAQNGGIASRQAVADLFEVDEVLVGAARSNTAKRGQTATLTRLWGKHIAALYIPPVLTGQGEVAWGATFEFGDRIAGAEFDRDIGLRGGQRVRVGESVKERIIANRAGYFIQNAVA